MQLGQNDLFLIFSGASFLWLAALTFFLVKTIRHYRRLTAGITKKDLRTILERTLKNIKDNEKQIKEILKNLEAIEAKGELHLQKIGFLRYNPFKTTGGDQSFILALLDGQDNGVVFSSLHSREATRIYAKPVKAGGAEKYKLSNEEEKVIKGAKKAGLL